MKIRDARLDIVRGIAIIVIAINHVTVLLVKLGYSGRRIPSLDTVGPSSAAELFVALSGYMVGLVYFGRADLVRTLWARLRKLYVINLLAFVVSAVVLSFASAKVVEASGFQRYLQPEHTVAAASFLVLLKMPFMLDVLPLYMLLMAGVPAVRAVYRRSHVTFWMAAVGTWLVAQVWYALDPSAAPAAILGWGFGPLGWQLLFYGMMPLGAARFHLRLLDWLSADARRAWAVVAAFVAWAIVDRMIQTGVLLNPGLAQKPQLGIVRLTHGLLTMATLFAVLSLSDKVQTTRPAAWIAAVGRNSLYCYAASIPLTFAAVAIWAAVHGSRLMYLLVVAGVLTGTCSVAWFRSRRRLAAPPTPSAASARS
jgi:hypothetical protein